MVKKQSEAFHVSVALFPSLKQNFIAYRSFKVSLRSDCIFEIHQLWQSGFSRVYSNCCCSCSLEPEIIKSGQSSHKMYSNNILNIQESTTILNACTKKKNSGNLLNAPRIFIKGSYFTMICVRFCCCVKWIHSFNFITVNSWICHAMNLLIALQIHPMLNFTLVSVFVAKFRVQSLPLGIL